MMSISWEAKVFLALLPVSLVLLLGLFSEASAGLISLKSKEQVEEQIQNVASSTCQDILYPELCVSTISTFRDLQSRSRSGQEIISGLLNSTVFEVRDAATNCSQIRKQLEKILDPMDRQALDDCLELFDDTISELGASISDSSSSSSECAFRQHYMDVQIRLSAAMTYQYTCLDGFAFSHKKYIRKLFEGTLRWIIHHLSNIMSMLNKIRKPRSPRNTDALPTGFGTMKDGYPTWLTKEDRQLLETPVDGIKFNVTVAKDGSGDFTTINQAVQAAPDSGNCQRFVIYIMAGVYYEYVEVGRNKSMIMLVGDGIGQTLIKGNKSVGGGSTTFRSATVAVVGEKFIGRGITFENYAGPSNGQAVALRVNSNNTVFYRCSFLGYQDTLYVLSLRQFFRECDIYGTIDFIFGNSIVVFQECNMYVRRPLPNQRNMVTAQGRSDPAQVTGISILNCTIDAGPDLKPVEFLFETYLGRPWRPYSRTVILLSYLGSLIDPAGWHSWSGDTGLDTLYYGEYNNTGPGSNTSQRVDWPGYRVITDETVANKFTVRNFIQGEEWLPETGIPFYLDLKPDDKPHIEMMEGREEAMIDDQ